jgi:hypothetical protein
MWIMAAYSRQNARELTDSPTSHMGEAIMYSERPRLLTKLNVYRYTNRQYETGKVNYAEVHVFPKLFFSILHTSLCSQILFL